MAELEVAKHGKNVIHLMTKREHRLSHRIREIAIEVAIIVFAVSMSIWLHRLSEHRHQQQEARTCVVGLNSDDPRAHYSLVTSPKGKRLLTRMAATTQHYARYQQYIDASREIIKAIDEAYPEQAGKKA